MAITDITTGDFVNQGRDKVNAAFGEIPVSFVPTPDGNLLITKHNGEVVTVPLKNFFALLTTTFGSLAVNMATPLAAGKVLLVDGDIPEQFQSNNRVLTAYQVANLIAQLIPVFDLTGAINGQALLVQKDENGNISIRPGTLNRYGLGRGFTALAYPDFYGGDFDSTDFNT